ncbi:hypothetical protein QOT17_005817 [Balamuthia mandrillaris]
MNRDHSVMRLPGLRENNRLLSLAFGVLFLVSSHAPTVLAKAAVPYVEGESYLAEWPEEGPSLRLYPKDPKTGAVIREEFFGMDVLGFQEKVLCACCRETTLGFSVVNCNDFAEEGLGPLVDLRNVTWTIEEHEPGRHITWTTSNFSGEAVLKYTFEDLFEERLVNISNGNTTRTIGFNKGRMKFTITFDNYSPLMFNVTEEPDRYFGLTIMKRFFLSRPVTYSPLLGVFGLDGTPSEYQIPLAIQTADEPVLKASFAQTMFSVQDPPSASQVLLPKAEWGFENLDAVQRDLYYVNGEIHGQNIELVFAGARYVFYDPDISILLGSPEEDGADGDADTAEDGAIDAASSSSGPNRNDEDEDVDVALPIALSVTGAAIVILLAVAGALFVRYHRNRRERRRSIALEETVNF